MEVRLHACLDRSSDDVGWVGKALTEEQEKRKRVSRRRGAKVRREGKLYLCDVSIDKRRSSDGAGKVKEAVCVHRILPSKNRRLNVRIRNLIHENTKKGENIKERTKRSAGETFFSYVNKFSCFVSVSLSICNNQRNRLAIIANLTKSSLAIMTSSL